MPPRAEFGLGRLCGSSPYRDVTVCLSTQLETCALFVKTRVTTTMTRTWFHAKQQRVKARRTCGADRGKESAESVDAFLLSPRCCLVTESQLFSSFVCERVFGSCNKLGLHPPCNNTSNIQRRSFNRHERVLPDLLVFFSSLLFPHRCSVKFFCHPPSSQINLI